VRLWGKTGGIQSGNGLHYRPVSMILGELVKGKKPGGGVGYFLLPEKNMAVHKAPELKLYVNVKVKG
jgi:hypothetical protein